ncbi:MAG: putative signal transducing protein [Desulfocucumaceae bacterium]
MDDLVLLASLFNPVEAHILRGLLKSRGIEAFLFDERAASYIPMLIGGIRLMVRKSDLERAKKIISREDTPQD